MFCIVLNSNYLINYHGSIKTIREFASRQNDNDTIHSPFHFEWLIGKFLSSLIKDDTTLVEPPRDNPELKPLAVPHLNN